MSQRIYICLGLNGDVINVLPMMLADAKAGQRSAVMVSKEFAGVMDGVSYADCIPFDGTMFELKRAYEIAVKMSNDVKVCQTAGPEDAVKKLAYAQIGSDHSVTDSFDREAWKLAGRLSEWGTHPLVFDQRDPEREKEWLPRKHRGPSKPIMLVSTAGKSSPFQYKDLLLILLRLQFHNWNVIDISDFKCHRLYDLLGLFEAASLLVTTDSAALHLAQAVLSLPVVALVQDQPRLWYGSAWRPTHIAHIRYGDFAAEAVDMLHAIESAGNYGSFFRRDLRAPRIIHAWTPADAWSPLKEASGSEEHAEARVTWTKEYLDDNWIECRLGIGAFGRSCRCLSKEEPKRLPFVRDMINLAKQMANDDDVICLTRANFKFWPNIGREILAKNPCYCHRSVEGQYSPHVDMFAFSKAWWDSVKKDYPDFVFGKDQYWHRVLWEIMKANSGTELEAKS